MFWLDFCEPFDCLCFAVADFADELAFLSELAAVTALAFLSAELLVVAVAELFLLGVSFFGLAVFFNGLFLAGLCCLLGVADLALVLLFAFDEVLLEACENLSMNKYRSPTAEPTATTTAIRPWGVRSTRLASSLNLLWVDEAMIIC